jgi:molybdopterin-containing oxidoreductase family iron-sulfur binding subunit
MERGTSPVPERPWIELDASLERPAFGERAEREAAGADETIPLDRRSFLALAGLSASLAACSRLPVRHALPYLVAPEEITPGVSTHYASTCFACPAACGLVATVRDGRPVKLEGHPDHPLSRGGLCALGQGDLRALYDAGRLRGASVGGRAATWAEADAAVKAGLEQAVRARKAVYVLSRTLTSPTLRAAAAAFCERWGGRLVEHDPEAEPHSAVLEAYEVLHGRPLAPSLEIAAADVLVTLGSDLLGAGPDPVAHTAAWSARRRDPSRPAPRHVHVEGSLSLTGANADERWLASAEDRRRIALWLLHHVAVRASDPLADVVLRSLDAPALGEFLRPVEALVTELLAARGRSLLVTATDDRAEALAIALANRLLGNEGRTLDLDRPSLVRRGLDRDLAALRAALAAGEVGALFVLGLDPVDQLPDGEAFAAGLRRAPLTIAVTDRPTATAAACRVVAAAHHPLECWGDAEPRPGVLTLAQPAIRPLFDTRAPLSSLLVWAGAPASDDRLYLRERWGREVLRAADEVALEAAWRAAVSRGIAQSGAPATRLPAAAKPGDAAAALRAALEAAPTVEAAPFEAELVGEVALRDGSRAHVPWLRELADPLTRVAWTPCARLAPEAARALGVTDGDVVAVSVGEQRLELPARVLPGQHPRVVGVPVGYGRPDGDGSRPRANAYRLARLEADGRARRRGLPARVERTGRRERLPLVQPQPSSEGRPVVFQVAARDEHVHGAHLPAGRDLWPDHDRGAPQWQMAIDLDSCTGCSACVVACQAENNVAVVGPQEVARNRGMHWIRIDRYFAGDPARPDVLFEPMMCSQCHHAPCETVCPVAATVHSEDGLNQQVYNRCVGTRYCANNCPYKVRAFNWFDNQPSEALERMVLNPDVVVRARGVMEKCSFCVQRIQAARIAARAEGRAEVPEVQTACQQSCPARAIHFGDGGDPEIASRHADPRAFRVLAELGVGPRITYLARVRTRAASTAGGHASEPGPSSGKAGGHS